MKVKFVFLCSGKLPENGTVVPKHDMMYLLTAIGLTPGDCRTVHIYTQTIHRTTQSTQTIHRTTQEFWKIAGRLVFASYTLAFALQLRKKQGKTSVKVAEECQLAR